MDKQTKNDLETITAEYAGWNDDMQKMWMESYNRIVRQLDMVEETIVRMWNELGYSFDQILEAFDMKPSELRQYLEDAA
jgi:hypothetical protein